MSEAAAGDLCRVTLIAPRVRLDIALPAAVPLAALLPTMLWHSGEKLAEEGLPHGGWAVQRAAEGPLDTGRTIAALGIKDGEILYLRPRDEALPPAVFDDTVDAITTALREQSRRWTPAATRAASLTATGLLLAGGAAALAVAGGVFSRAGAGHGGAARAAVVAGGTVEARGGAWLVVAMAAAVALVGMLGAAAASRAFGDGLLGTVLAIGALPYAFLTGQLALSAGLADIGSSVPAFLVGCASFLVAAAFGAAAVGDGASLLIGAVVAGFLAVAGSLLALATSGPGAAAVVVSVVLVLTPAIAPAAYRIARLPRPAVPITPQELRQRGEQVDFPDVTRRAIDADRAVAALVAATCALTVAGLAIMLKDGRWAASALAAIASGLLLLRVRLFASVVQRAWLLGSGLAGTIMLVVVLAGRSGPAMSACLVVALAAWAGLAAWRVIAGERRRSPSIGRITDLAELLATIATIPLALEVIGAFGLVRSLGG